MPEFPAPAAGADRSAVEVAAKHLAPLGEQVQRNGPLGVLTTYRVGGAAALLVTARDVSDLAAVASASRASGLPVLTVGKGSNLLVSDAGFPGIALILEPDAFSGIEIHGTTVRAGAAVALPVLARQSVEAGLTGMEWAVGVPGSVGGAVRMNAGGHGSDIAHHLIRATVFDLRKQDGASQWRIADLDYSYRHSAVTPQHVVIEASFGLANGDPGAGKETIREIVRWRRDHQPGGQNAGSVFTNPPGSSAGALIDSAGLKGRRWRSAEVSTKHANFIQADQGGSADDVRELILLVRREVERRHGISLQPEVRMIGFEMDQPRVEDQA
ncbi:MAG TPA: UDP-N-acetylmuramate dehydrogenase [Acidimicrobiales bacterium]|nr:UDP-N-acetylmuramate dehydrogenase [Acidimicrobiales bacterium]